MDEAQALLDQYPMQVKMYERKPEFAALDLVEKASFLREMMQIPEAAPAAPKVETFDDIISSMAASMVLEVQEHNPDLEIIHAPIFDQEEVVRKARAIADEAFRR